PNAALESQYLGVPIVATAGGGTTDAVAHGLTGFLAGVSDADALTGHLTRVLTDDALRARLSAAGPALVPSRFGLERLPEDPTAVYETMWLPPTQRQLVVTAGLEDGPVSRVA